jgi:hypothetical protein
LQWIRARVWWFYGDLKAFAAMDQVLEAVAPVGGHESAS